MPAYTFGMTSTTIKVSTDTRDRLKTQAAAAHVSLGEYLSRLADEGERALRFEALRTAISRTSDADRRTYEAETMTWLDADLGI